MRFNFVALLCTRCLVRSPPGQSLLQIDDGSASFQRKICHIANRLVGARLCVPSRTIGLWLIELNASLSC